MEEKDLNIKVECGVSTFEIFTKSNKDSINNFIQDFPKFETIRLESSYSIIAPEEVRVMIYFEDTTINMRFITLYFKDLIDFIINFVLHNKDVEIDEKC